MTCLCSLAVPTRAGAPDSGIYARQTYRGYDQGTVGAIQLFRFPGSAGDPVGDHLSLLAGTMGVEVQLLYGTTSGRDLGPVTRPMSLNRRACVHVLSRGFGEAVLAGAPQAGLRAYAAIDVTDPHAEVPSIPRAVRARYYARTAEGSVVLGATPELVRELGAGLGTPRPGTRCAEDVAAACLVLGDLLAAGNAYRSAFSGRPMPRSPEAEVVCGFEGTPTGPIRRRSRILLAGAGALGHAFLEALLADDVTRHALRRGRLVVVDPDFFSESNLSRQTLAGSRSAVGRGKADVTTAQLRARWAGRTPEIVSIGTEFRPEHMERHDPDVVGLFTDSFRSRAEVWNAARTRPGRLVLCAGTEFTFGQVRAVVTGEGRCFDHGPEELALEAERETARMACGHGVPANVLSNALTGALALLETRRWLLGGCVGPAQRSIDWMAPERHLAGNALEPCECGRQGRDR